MDNNTLTQQQISALRTLQESYDALADASSAQATATALETAKQAILTALNPKATTADVTAAKQAILDALSHIAPEDPNSKAVAQFFGLPSALPQFTYATDQEVIDIVDDVYNAYFPNAVQDAETNNND